MFRTVLCTLAALLLHTGWLHAADEAPAPATAIATDSTPAAEPAADAPKSLEDRLAALEAGNKATTDSMNQLTFNAGDNAWMLVSTLLVLMMTGPGLALFYSGLVRRKNVLGTMMQSFACMAVVSVIWAIYGFAIAFGDGGGATPADGGNAFWGGFKQYIMLANVFTDAKGLLVGPNADYAMSIPFGTFCVFQLMFAIITPGLICGAYAERMKFSGMLLFSALWLTFIYLPLAHMVWGKNGYFNWGFNGNMGGAFDFAGGTVVHISSGIAALVCALFLGKRKGYPQRPMMPHSIVLSFIGACLLWVGWFGFNAGSALCASGLATLAFANTHLAAAAAAVTWPLAEWILRGKPTVLGGISGAVAGLVAITPAAGFVTTSSALIIGAIAGVLCFASSSYLKRALGYDDALDAFGVHGVGGMWGAIATGLFLAPAVNPNIPFLNADLAKALDAGTHPVIFLQIKAVVITVLMSGIGSAIILTIVKFTVGIRVSEDDEDRGLDLTQHGEEGYGEAA